MRETEVKKGAGFLVWTMRSLAFTINWDGEGCRWNSFGGKIRGSVWDMWRRRCANGEGKWAMRYTSLKFGERGQSWGNIHWSTDSILMIFQATELSVFSKGVLGPEEGVLGRWRVGLHGACFPECVEEDMCILGRCNSIRKSCTYSSCYSSMCKGSLIKVPERPECDCYLKQFLWDYHSVFSWS